MNLFENLYNYKENNTLGKLICVAEEISNRVKNDLPNIIVFFDNGAHDLQKQGYDGYYLWVGYKHKGSRSENKKEELLRKAISKIYDDFELYLKDKGIINPRIIIQDFLKTSDAYRLICIEDGESNIKIN